MAETKSTCTVSDCLRPVKIVKRGLCSAHYMAAWKAGALTAVVLDARICVACGGSYVPAHSLSKYCSQRCVNKVRDQKRGPNCGSCGKKMFLARSMAKVPTCQECRRSRDGYRDRAAGSREQHWNCGACGKACSRPATRGQRPKWCDGCRRALHNRDIKVTPAERVGIYEADGWHCWLCEGAVDRSLIGSASIWRPSLDHVVPRVHGGSDEVDNLRLAHWWCNVARSDGRAYSPEDFRVSA